MKKSLIFKILYLFLILIVCAGASVFATNTYLASQVTYGSTNVEEALNGLFTLKENTYNFSTDEQIVGKWIDNKPIYRTIIQMPNGTVSSTASVISKDLTSLKIKEMLSMTGFMNWGNSTIKRCIPYILNTTINIPVTPSFEENNLKIHLYRSSSTTEISNIYMTLIYTKTTD